MMSKYQALDFSVITYTYRCFYYIGVFISHVFLEYINGIQLQKFLEGGFISLDFSKYIYNTLNKISNDHMKKL